MSKLQPVLIVGQDGQTPVQPIQPGDLPALAQDASIAALLAAVQSLPLSSTKGTEVTVSLVAAVADAAVALGTLTTVHKVRVQALSGATATLKIGATTEAPITLAVGDDLDGLAVGALFLNSPGGAGGTITLQLFGR